MRPLINATGIIFYDGLKEPPLAEEAVKASNAVAYSHSGLEQLALSSLSRFKHPGELFSNLTGAEDTLLVNNIMAGFFLVFHSLARGKEVIVSRRDLLSEKITPSFSAITAGSGARLKKVGKKESASITDYSSAVHGNSACLLKISGVNGTGLPADSELIRLGREKNIPVIKFMSYASLLDLSPFGLPADWQLQQAVAKGFDIIVCAGDRLLGGPPLGIIAGKEKYLSLIKKEPLKAALNADRINMAALEATLELYLDEEDALQKVPLLRMISALPDGIEDRSRRLIGILKETLHGQFNVDLAAEDAFLTGRCHGLASLPSFQVSLSSSQFSARQICRLLYQGDPPIIPRVKKGKVLLDLRSVLEEEDDFLLNSLLDSLQQENDKRENRVLDNVPSLIWVVDRENNFVFANKACGMFWGMDPESIVGLKIDDVLKQSEVQPLLEAKEKVIETGQYLKMEAGLESNDGTAKWLDIILTPVFESELESQKGISAVTFTASDVTDRKQNEEELKYVGMHDSLTGLYNRVYFEEETRRLDSERHYPISIVVCDVDGLKLVNDIMGHDKGDEHLKAAAAIIRKPFRASDVVARIGGDEFAVILPSTPENVVREIAGRISKAVDEYNQGKQSIPLSLSVGFATGAYGFGGIKEILKQADSNMYKNKFARSDEAKKGIVDSLLALLAERDFKTNGNDERLTRMVLLLGQAVGMPYEEIKNMLLLSRVHDIGKVGIDESIIFKQGTLSTDEWEEMKSHPEIGYRIARFSPEMSPIANYILQHHEHWDGSGYPRGLKGNNIHLYSRIIAIIDAYEAMTSPRPYRDALTHQEAIAELKRNSGVQFDPRLVEIFINLIDQECLIQ